MNQKLSDWASIAEITSGVAVVVTLVFLILGIRENTEVARADAYSDLTRDLNDLAIAITQDDRLHNVWQTYHAGNAVALNDEEVARLGVLVRITFRVFETAYYRMQYGTLGESEWARFEESSCYHRGLQTHRLWEEASGTLTSEFRNLCG